MATLKNQATAYCTIDKTPLASAEVRDINKVAKVLAKHGAVSAERAAKLTKQSVRSAQWCFFMLGAMPTTSGLFVF